MLIRVDSNQHLKANRGSTRYSQRNQHGELSYFHALRPTRLDEIKNLRLAVQVGILGASRISESPGSNPARCSGASWFDLMPTNIHLHSSFWRVTRRLSR